MPGETHCPLCAGSDVPLFHEDIHRPYLRCRQCQLVFVPPEFHLDAAAEKREYDLHDNRTDDPGYRAFLSRLAAPLARQLPAHASGLDFGCGPGPALADMLREEGFEVALFDPFYFPDERALAGAYDFICATEVVEHLHRPGVELSRLWELLRPGGWLGIMTRLVRDADAFAGWHYIRDPTHVCFFSRATWRWWASLRGVQPQFPAADVILLRKPRGTKPEVSPQCSEVP